MLDLMEDEGVDKFYLSHLNYAGRGNKNRKDDAHTDITRAAMDLLFDTAWTYAPRHPQGIRHRQQRRRRRLSAALGAPPHFPEREATSRAKLAQWGGNASGVNIANIDNLGNVHPDTFWWHYPLGNVRERPFSQIWPDTSDPLMAGLKQSPRPVGGRCGECRYSTSAAATPGCAPSSSPAIPGPRIRPAI
jgi:Fe-coproporphyrin III synthase